MFNLQVIDVYPNKNQHQLSIQQQLWKSDIKRCCQIHKLAPLTPIKKQHKIWISGVMAHQTLNRKHLRVWEKQDNLLKFHPLIDIDEREFFYQIGKNKLPEHPLTAVGFGSVGCTHCTVKGTGRNGRWQGQEKTECGLHLRDSN